MFYNLSKKITKFTQIILLNIIFYIQPKEKTIETETQSLKPST